ncbi:LAGLIDADG family homing endonuclease [Ectothiorhodosinus mongolicus]|nr:LAGLIDADG family homing endonuclease [Ectothiorhodosinus mongolicus]
MNMTLSKIDAAYIAGVIDGEGTITLVRKHRGENRQLSVSISSTERPLLEYILETLAAGKITTKRTYSAAHSPGYTYAIYNRQAFHLLQHVSPFLRTYKRLRADLILAHYLALTPRNGRYSASIMERRKAFEEAVLNTRARS